MVLWFALGKKKIISNVIHQNETIIVVSANHDSLFPKYFRRPQLFADDWSKKIKYLCLGKGSLEASIINTFTPRSDGHKFKPLPTISILSSANR